MWNIQKMASLAKKEEECFPLGELPDTCLYEVYRFAFKNNCAHDNTMMRHNLITLSDLQVSSHLPLSDLLSLRMVCRRVSSWAERVLSSRRMPNQEQQVSEHYMREMKDTK